MAHIKEQMIEENISDPIVESLTSLMYAFNRNIHHLKLYGHDPMYRKSLIENTIEIETEIIEAFQDCNNMITMRKNLKYRNSI